MHRFIVLEGLDGCGKSTQISLLLNWLDASAIPYRYLHFPRIDTPFYGEMIARFLRGEFGEAGHVDPHLVALLYAGDRAGANRTLCEWLEDGMVVVVDRYVYSNMAFQAAKISDPEQRIDLIRWIDKLEFDYHRLRRPDVSLYLDVPFGFVRDTLSAGRSGSDREYLGGADDIHENSLDLQRRVHEQYLALCSEREDLQLVQCSEGNDMLSPETVHKRLLGMLDL